MIKSFTPLKLMGRNRWPYLLGVMGYNTVMAFCFNIVMAILMKDLFNAASQGQRNLFLRAIIIGLSSLILAIIVQPIFAYVYAKAQKNTMKEIREKAFNHMIQLPIYYFEAEHRGNVMSKLTNDIKIIEDVYDIYLKRLAFILLLGTGSTILMFIYDWKIALYALLFEGLSIYTSIRISRKIKRASGTVQLSRSKVTGKILDIISGFKTSKIFQVEEVMVNDYKIESDNLLESEKRRDSWTAIINTSGHFFSTAKSLGIIILGLYFISKEMWDIGTLIAMFNLQNNMGVFSDLGDAIGQLQSSMAGVERVENLLQESVEYDNGKKIHGEYYGEKSIELTNLEFAYGEKKVLRKLNMNIKKGQSVAIVGKSGSGKSTVAKLLLGFYHIKHGELKINGMISENYSLEELRNKISYVPQEAHLFNGSIAENIRYGRLESTIEDIVKAAKMANAHDFIMAQKDGYDTIIGEDGANLSGGQKQRLAIARAINKGSDILLLDEATSALDAESQGKVQKTLEKLMGERTMVIIAHRLSTVKNVDNIYVLDNGEVVEEGNHNQLMLKEGIYSKMYNEQSA